MAEMAPGKLLSVDSMESLESGLKCRHIHYSCLKLNKMCVALIVYALSVTFSICFVPTHQSLQIYIKD